MMVKNMIILWGDSGIYLRRYEDITFYSTIDLNYLLGGGLAHFHGEVSLAVL